MTTKHFLLACITLLLLRQAAWAQSIGDLPLDNRQSLLQDLAFLSFPATATNVPRQGDLMGPLPDETKESRVIFDQGKMRLVFSAQNLFALGGNNLMAEIQASDAKIGVQTRQLIDRDGLLGILSTPTTFDSTKEAIFINSLLVQLPNKTLFRVNCYINPAAFGQKAQFQRLTERVFETLALGTRTEDLAARKVTLPLMHAPKEGLLFDLPANMKVVPGKGHDFQVFTYKEFAAYNADVWKQVIVYEGDHPGLICKDIGVDPKSGKPVKGMFLENKVVWLAYDVPDQGIFLMERVIELQTPAGSKMQFHVAMLSNQKTVLPELTDLVARIRLVKL